MKKIISSTIVLVIITLVAGLALSAVYELTKEPIAAAEEAAKQNAYRMVMSEADAFVPQSIPSEGSAVDECLIAQKADATVGYVVTATSPNGYGGNITVVVGVRPDGSINALSVLSQSETAGLGAVCAEDKFTSQFKGLSGVIEYTKGDHTADNQIDAISGATITTSAVTEAVNAALAYVNTTYLAGEGN